ncbi:GSCOCG00002716001-RA-CDS [Cotesia congregata]|nr:GSCOCG00002716001-RA-CDS [Cotesia congregata]
MDIKILNVLGIIGFDGITKHGLQLHPNNNHLIYSMGNKVTVKTIETGEQIFLSGHTNVITTLCISPCGKYIASGQLTHLGFKAMVIIWNYEEKNMRGSYEIHKGKIEDICFTCKSNYLISLGGRDDGKIIIWDIDKNMAICGFIFLIFAGAFASTDITGNAVTLARANLRDRCFLTGGDGTLRIWQIDPDARKVYGSYIKVGKIRRCINCIAIDDKDQEAYWGTSSGDIIMTRLNYDSDLNNLEPSTSPVMVGCYSKIPEDPKKLKTGVGNLYSGGVTQLILLPNKKIIVGTGNGTIELIEIVPIPAGAMAKQLVKLPCTPQIRTLKKTTVRGAVTSITWYEKNSFLVSTSCCEIYEINSTNLKSNIILTCHTDSVYDVAFPHNYSEIFATGSKNDIRLWQLESQKELLRITVPNFVCTSLCFFYNGKLILSAWNDGIIRAFKPQTGNLYFAIENAHIKAVSAIGITRDGKTLITGGCDGQVRVWQLFKDVQRLKAILKEHRGPITSLHVSHNDEEVISSSTDGTCVIWDIIDCSRKQVIMGNTMFMSAKFHPNGLQVLTCGTDRKVGYWETLDGTIVREVEGSTIASINCIDISPDGAYFVTGGNDCLVKFWEYITGDITHVGTGHAAVITACRFSSNSMNVVTTSADGAVIIWKNPFDDSADSRSVKSDSKKSRSSHEGSISRQSYPREENVGNISRRSVSSIDSIRTVHKGQKGNGSCQYDPIQPAKDNCQCKGDQEAPSSRTEKNIPSKLENSKIVSHKKIEQASARNSVKSFKNCCHGKDSKEKLSSTRTDSVQSILQDGYSQASETNQRNSINKNLVFVKSGKK